MEHVQEHLDNVRKSNIAAWSDVRLKSAAVATRTLL